MPSVVENLENASKMRLLRILRSELDVRDRAEIAFAMMQFSHDNKDDAAALSFGKQSIAFFEVCGIESEVDSLPRHPVIAGIQMPDRIHEGVVRHRMEMWGILSPK